MRDDHAAALAAYQNRELREQFEILHRAHHAGSDRYDMVLDVIACHLILAAKAIGYLDLMVLGLSEEKAKEMQERHIKGFREILELSVREGVGVRSKIETTELYQELKEILRESL